MAAVADIAADRLLSIREVAARLGVSTATIHRLLQNRELPYVQLGGKGTSLRISERALVEWLSERTRGPE